MVLWVVGSIPPGRLFESVFHNSCGKGRVMSHLVMWDDVYKICIGANRKEQPMKFPVSLAL